MERTAVIYASTYGSTKKYAEWLADSLHADLYDITKIRADKLNDYKVLVFGGGVYAFGVNGANFVAKNFEMFRYKKLVYFTVGISEPENNDIIKRIIDTNFSKEMQMNIRFFYLRGGIFYKKLSFIHKIVMAMVIRSLKKKSDKTKNEQFLIKTYGTSIDFTDAKNLEPLISYVNEIESKENSNA